MTTPCNSNSASYETTTTTNFTSKDNTSSADFTIPVVPLKSNKKAVKRNLALPVTTYYVRPLNRGQTFDIIASDTNPGIGIQSGEPKSPSELPLVAERKEETRSMVITSETVRRNTIALSSSQTKEIMLTKGNKVKEVERRVINIPEKTSNIQEYVNENVLEYLTSQKNKGLVKRRLTEEVRSL